MEIDELEERQDLLGAGDLREFSGLRPGDFGFVRRRRGDVNRLGLAVQLGCVRFLGFVPDVERVPGEVVGFVARQLDVPASLVGYGERDQTRSDHLVAVMDHLGFRHLGELGGKRLGEWLVDRAMEHHCPTVLFEQACEWLRSEGFLRPAVSAVERLIAAAAVEAHRRDLVDFGRELDGAESVHLLEGDPGTEVAGELGMRPDDYFIRKRRYSCFFGTEFEILLKGLRADTLILSGGHTDVCVHYTFVDAHQHDYFCRVVEDCVAGSSLDAHEASLRAMEYLQTGAVRSSAAVIAAFEDHQAKCPAGVI